jgi:hypothetical protein
VIVSAVLDDEHTLADQRRSGAQGDRVLTTDRR